MLVVCVSPLPLRGVSLVSVSYRCVFAAARSAIRTQCLLQYIMARFRERPSSVCVSVCVTETSVGPPLTQAHGVLHRRFLTYPQCIANLRRMDKLYLKILL